MTSLTIISYHYVRDLARSRYPLIKGRDISEFRAQLDYIGRTYTVVTAEQVCAAINGGDPLPPNGAWLTFDDGYLDHYVNVFPLLHERGWQGSFFPPAAIMKGEILQVNKIHFVLASKVNVDAIIDDIRRFVEARREEANIRPFEQYWSELAKTPRFDTVEVAFVKRMLQYALPEAIREELVDQLFARYVCVDSAAFAAELYLTMDQLRTMNNSGMYIGCHGDKHHWLDRLNHACQAAEIDRSLAFLKELGSQVDNWVMCYPYGAYNVDLLGILKTRGCTAALTTRKGVAILGEDRALELPRLDTNDLPIA